MKKFLEVDTGKTFWSPSIVKFGDPEQMFKNSAVYVFGDEDDFLILKTLGTLTQIEFDRSEAIEFLNKRLSFTKMKDLVEGELAEMRIRL